MQDPYWPSKLRKVRLSYLTATLLHSNVKSKKFENKSCEAACTYNLVDLYLKCCYPTVNHLGIIDSKHISKTFL